jgi:hypothetical protein
MNLSINLMTRFKLLLGFVLNVNKVAFQLSESKLGHLSFSVHCGKITQDGYLSLTSFFKNNSPP